MRKASKAFRRSDRFLSFRAQDGQPTGSRQQGGQQQHFAVMMMHGRCDTVPRTVTQFYSRTVTQFRRKLKCLNRHM